MYILSRVEKLMRRSSSSNLAINSMAATGYPNYNLQGIRQVYGNRFDPQGLQNLQPMWSGLVGPIRLEAAAAAR